MIHSRLEANDNEKYLRTLDGWFVKLNGWTAQVDEKVPFKTLLHVFRPLLHVILLIWKNSNHYCTPPRLTRTGRRGRGSSRCPPVFSYM